MAKVELDETELAELQRVNKFAQAALANPKTRADILRIQKTLNPESVIPELDATENVMKSVNGVKEQMDAFMKKLEDRDAKAAEDARTSQLAAKMQAGQDFLTKKGYSADGIKKIEDLMLAEGISSYAAGLAYFEQLNPPAEPADASRNSRFGESLGPDIQSDDFKELWESQGQSDNWLQNTLKNVQKQFRQ